MKIYYWVHAGEWTYHYYTNKAKAWQECRWAGKDEMIGMPVQVGDPVAMLEKQDKLIEELYNRIVELEVELADQ